MTASNEMRHTYCLHIHEEPAFPLSYGRIAIADLMPFRKGYLLTRINVPREFRGNGIGTKLLKLILEDADRTCSIIYVHPSASEPEWQELLVAWYMKFGFREDAQREGELLRSPDPDSMRGEESGTGESMESMAASEPAIDYDYDFGMSEITDAFNVLETTKVYGRLVADITERYSNDTPEFWQELRKAMKEMMRLIEEEMMRQLSG